MFYHLGSTLSHTTNDNQMMKERVVLWKLSSIWMTMHVPWIEFKFNWVQIQVNYIQISKVNFKALNQIQISLNSIQKFNRIRTQLNWIEIQWNSIKEKGNGNCCTMYWKYAYHFHQPWVWSSKKKYTTPKKHKSRFSPCIQKFWNSFNYNEFYVYVKL